MKNVPVENIIRGDYKMNTKVVVINGERINYDGSIDYNILSDNVVVYKDSTSDEVIERIKGAGIVVSKEFPLKRDMIERFDDSVKLLCEAGTGYNNIDLEACKGKGIMVCNIPAYSSECVAQTAMMMILNLASSMRIQMNMLHDKNHSNFTDRLQVNHFELMGKTLGIVGVGNIGSEVAKIANAFGMKVIAYRRTPSVNTDLITYVTLDEVLKNSEFISLHCPLSDETYHLIGEKQLKMMKKTSFIINTARGALIDEKALIAALQNKVIAGAGLDVQEIEPPTSDNPLYDMENVILTPHMGWRGKETRKRLVGILADNIKHYIDGKPINVVSK